jgi:hypothetical protein
MRGRPSLRWFPGEVGARHDEFVVTLQRSGWMVLAWRAHM